MPVRKKPTKSKYPSTIAKLTDEHEDLGRRFTAQERLMGDIKKDLHQHRKEEKDNGKRIERLEDVCYALVGGMEQLLGGKKLVIKRRKKA